MLAILKCIIFSGSSSQYLIPALSSASHQDAVNIFSHLVRLWLEYVWTRDYVEMNPRHQYHHYNWLGQLLIGSPFGVSPTPLRVTNLYASEKSLLFEKIETSQHHAFLLNDISLHHLIKFVTAAANYSMTIRWGLVDAGVLPLVLLAFVDGVPSLLFGLHLTLTRYIWGGFSGVEFPDELNAAIIPLTLVNAEITKILHLIQAPQVRTLHHTKNCNRLFFPAE